jgi:hypothetical protein
MKNDKVLAAYYLAVPRFHLGFDVNSSEMEK